MGDREEKKKKKKYPITNFELIILNLIRILDVNS